MSVCYTAWADLDAASELEAQNHGLEQYISEMPDLLAKTDNNEQLKMEVLQVLVLVFICTKKASISMQIGLCPQADINVAISTVIIMGRICSSM